MPTQIEQAKRWATFNESGFTHASEEEPTMSLPAPTYPTTPTEGKRKNRPPRRRPQKHGTPAPKKDKPMRRGEPE